MSHFYIVLDLSQTAERLKYTISLGILGLEYTLPAHPILEKVMIGLPPRLNGSV